MTKKNVIAQDPIGDGVGARKLKVRFSLSRTGHDIDTRDVRRENVQKFMKYISKLLNWASPGTNLTQFIIKICI